MKVQIALLLVALAACAYSTPIDGEAVAPAFDAYSDVRLLLQTRSNRLNPQQLAFRNLQSVTGGGSHFDRNRPTRFLIHGWLEDDEADISTATSAELLDYYDFNVIFVDWSAGSQTINYLGASNRVEPIGRFVASYIDFLAENNLIQWNRLTVIGFSLGAHAAGHVGKNVRLGRINSIVGLDPAGPLFSVRNSEGRIDAGDARYVECIHTNGPTLVLVGAGIGAPICDSDFFPNGGSSQPGCLTNTCSHSRAVHYYVESISNNGFHALQCDSRDNISSRRCTQSPGAWMGGDDLNFQKYHAGSFYLETNRNRPFAQGPARS